MHTKAPAEAPPAQVARSAAERPAADVAGPAGLELGGASPAHLLALQRLAGNAAVSAALGARPTVQRQPPATATDAREKITKALQSGQYLDVADIDDFGPASDDERVSLSQICISGGYVAPQDASQKVLRLWSEMGGRLPAVVTAHEKEWDAATRFAPPLMQLAPVTDAQTAFAAALRSMAVDNLTQNKQLVEDRKKALGVDGGQALTDEQKDQMRAAIQSMALHAWDMKQQQTKARTLVVGYESQDLGFGEGEARFDPAGPPKFRRTLFSTPQAQWEDVNSAWQDAENELARIGNDYPELYEASQGDGAALQTVAAEPAATFGDRVKEQLLKLDERIDKVRGMVDGGQLELLELGLLTKAVQAGGHPSPGHDWTQGFDHWASDRAIETHKADQAAVQALLTSVEDMAMLVAVFTGGLGRVLAAGVAIGVEAFKAGQAVIQADQLQTAASVTPKSGTAMVDKAQADEKKTEAVANIVKAVINALLVGGPALNEGLQLIRLRALVQDEALLTELRQLAGRDANLETLLRRNPDPLAVRDLLKRAGSGLKAIDILDRQDLFRQRFAERYAKDIADVQKLKAQFPELASIPDEDLVALRGYTREDYDMINRALRGQEADAEMERLQPYIDSVSSALDQLPKYQGVVSRIEHGTEAEYTAGEVVTKDAFTSTYGAGGKISMKGNVMLKIDSLSGRDVSRIAKFANEREVLFPAGTRFQVVSKKELLPGSGAYQIHLREIAQ